MAASFSVRCFYRYTIPITVLEILCTERACLHRHGPDTAAFNLIFAVETFEKLCVLPPKGESACHRTRSFLCMNMFVIAGTCEQLVARTYSLEWEVFDYFVFCCPSNCTLSQMFRRKGNHRQGKSCRMLIDLWRIVMLPNETCLQRLNMPNI